jgi:hypothetical protein
MTADENFKSTWSAIFSRKGGSGSTTRLWEDWDENARTAVIRAASFERDELPVVLANTKPGVSVLLTTRKLICESGTASLREIVGIKPVGFSEQRKDQLNEIDVVLSSGQLLRLIVESGSSYFAMWSVLLHISTRNAHRPLAS